MDRALVQGGIFGLSVLAFTAVIREGIETSLFLVGQATAASEANAGATARWSARSSASSSRSPSATASTTAPGDQPPTFFRWTGIALIFIAAGLLSHAVHEFIEAGSIPFGSGTAFDISGVLPHSGEIAETGRRDRGQLLRALVGYPARPSGRPSSPARLPGGRALPLYLRPIKPTAPRRASGPAGSHGLTSAWNDAPAASSRQASPSPGGLA